MPDEMVRTAEIDKLTAWPRTTSEAKIIVGERNDAMNAATELLLKTVVSKNRISLPVDVGQIARKLDMRIRGGKIHENLFGTLSKNPNEPFIITLNDSIDMTEHRGRFTIAHEIGHYIRQYQDIQVEEGMKTVEERRENLSSTTINKKELWANTFAGSLLMPADIVRHYWSEGIRFEEIASIFNVSFAVLGARLDHLGLK